MTATATVRDDFTRVDANTLGASWTTDPLGDGPSNTPQITSNQAGISSYRNAWYNAVQVDSTVGDVELAIDVGTWLGASNANLQLCLVQQPGAGTVDGYYFEIDNNTSPMPAAAFKITNGALAAISGATGALAIAAGDQLIIRRILSTGTWRLLRDRAGVETQILSFVDTTFTGLFFGTLGGFDTTNAGLFDNFRFDNVNLATTSKTASDSATGSDSSAVAQSQPKAAADAAAVTDAPAGVVSTTGIAGTDGAAMSDVSGVSTVGGGGGAIPVPIGDVQVVDSSGTIVITVTTPTTAGEHGLIGWARESGIVGATVSDSRGNVWQVDAERDHTTQKAYAGAASCRFTTGLQVGDLITITLPTAFFSWRGAAAFKVPGLKPTGWFEGFASNEHAGSANPDVDSTPVTTTVANELLLGVASAGDFDTSTPGSSFTELFDVGSATRGMVTVAYRNVSATGAYPFTATLSAADAWVALVVAYKLADSTAPVAAEGIAAGEQAAVSVAQGRADTVTETEAPASAAAVTQVTGSDTATAGNISTVDSQTSTVEGTLTDTAQVTVPPTNKAASDQAAVADDAKIGVTGSDTATASDSAQAAAQASRSDQAAATEGAAATADVAATDQAAASDSSALTSVGGGPINVQVTDQAAVSEDARTDTVQQVVAADTAAATEQPATAVTQTGLTGTDTSAVAETAAVTPVSASPDELFLRAVGTILRQRTVVRGSGGGELGTFDDRTRPTSEQVLSLRDTHAREELEEVIGDLDALNAELPEMADNVNSVLVLGTAMQVELTYFAGDVAGGKSPYDRLEKRYDKRVAAVARNIGQARDGDPVGVTDATPSPVYSFPPAPLYDDQGW